MPSERDWLAAREFRQFVKEEAEKSRVNQDAEEYQKYVAQIEAEQRRCAPAQRIAPVSFAEWRKHIPEELKDALPAVRGAAATSTLCMRKLAEIAVVRLKNAELTDEELQTLGFDPDDRLFIAAAQVSVSAVKDIFARLANREPRYVHKLHYERIIDFLSRNKLVPSEKHVALAFNHLLGINALPTPEVEPQPEPERPDGVNQYGVNLSIEPNPEVDKQNRWERYTKDVVCTCPENGRQYTQYQLDRVDSETYRRLMRIPRNTEFRPEPQR